MNEMNQIRQGVWELKEEGMNIPVRIYATEKLFSDIEKGVITQAVNVSKLPGIVNASLVMPDGHYGYGFPIGGVAAFDKDIGGIVSPGGVGFDINCGIRLLTTNLDETALKPNLRELTDRLFRNVPSGLGSEGKLRLSNIQIDDILIDGAKWAVEEGYGVETDLEHTEENGRMIGANPENVDERAIKRGRPQMGTLGSGNHFLEIQKVESIYEKDIAQQFGIFTEGQVVIMIHCGSRGFGHQVASDYIKVMLSAVHKYGITLPDRQLACAPIGSPEAEKYISAMKCAVNYAFANRQIITHWVRETLKDIFKNDVETNLLYDVCHNIAKFESHDVNGVHKNLCVHRKGATRAFPAGRDEVPIAYRNVGQPVIVPGDMGRASYVLVGTETAMKETFGSVCHGAGRVMSREAAKRGYRGGDIKRKMESDGKIVRCASMEVLAEEVSDAYKNIDEVIKSVELAGLSKKIARLVPLGVVKG